MAVQFTIDTLMKAKKISNYGLSLTTHIRPGSIDSIRKNRAKVIKVDHIDKLCMALGCGPGEIMRIVNDEEGEEAHVQDKK